MRHTAGFTYGNQGTTALHKAYPGGSGNVAATMTGAEFIDALAKLPLHYQPGTTWDYSYGLDILGLAIESVAKQPLGRVLQDRLFGPLGMTDTAFTVPKEKAGRIARALPTDPVTGQPQSIRDQTQPWKFECGGGCLTSTALDYLKFAQMLLNRGSARRHARAGPQDGRVHDGGSPGPRRRRRQAAQLSRWSTSTATASVSAWRCGACRAWPASWARPATSAGLAPRARSSGSIRKEELAVVYMAQTPGAIRAHYRQVIATLVQQAIVDCELGAKRPAAGAA